MRSAELALALAVLAGSAGPAAAEWQYTQWGMTPAQVKHASHGAARDNEDRGLDAAGVTAELVAPYHGASLPFTAVFLFDDAERLEAVTLNPVGTVACPVMVRTLGSRYGKPEGGTDMEQAKTLRWNDVDGDNLVVYLDLGQGNCTVQYSRLPPSRDSGDDM